MVVIQNYGLISMRFSEEILAGLSIKIEKNILECLSNVVPNPGALGWKWAQKSGCFVTPLVSIFVMFFCKYLEIKTHYNGIKVKYKNKLNIHMNTS